ncbi:hypothetical protein ACAW74_12700 [Fibrella sp. WM1]|uniref:hypothetical protein n=1 Tax=Fibrella musci TaxID=3242485 RepID=UPI00351FEE0C
MRYLSVLVVGLGSMASLACTPSATEPISVGQDFMPLETGRFVVYDVTEQRYSLTAAPVTTTYQLKETVGSSYTDVTGQPAYRLQRYRRTTTSGTWSPDSLWTARLTDRAAIRTENGTDFVKLQFPVQERDRWNGNQFNPFDEDLYQARQVRQPYTVGSRLFDETVQVVQQDDSTLVSRTKRVEVYARQIGLVYKERVALQYCSTGACLGKAQIDFGVRQVFRAVAYGKE